MLAFVRILGLEVDVVVTRAGGFGGDSLNSRAGVAGALAVRSPVRLSRGRKTPTPPFWIFFGPLHFLNTTVTLMQARVRTLPFEDVVSRHPLPWLRGSGGWGGATSAPIRKGPFRNPWRGSLSAFVDPADRKPFPGMGACQPYDDSHPGIR